MTKLKRCISGLSTFLLLAFVVAMSAGAATAAVSISEPSDGATVRGEITVKVSGIPTGGYVIVKVDGGFMQATSQREFSLNTFDPLSFGTDANAKTDGEHKISVTGVDGSGKQTETATITINVANDTVDQEAPSVLLTHWVPVDRLEEKAQRYRVFAESNARSSADQASGGGATMGEDGEMMGGGGGAGASANSVSGLEWQYSALLRRTLRDVGMFDGAANIRVSVAEAFQRQREGQASDMGEGGIDGENVAAPSSKKSKDGWNPTWTVAPENGSYFVKTITADGREINATRKKPTIAISDLLPSFPKEEVQPGSRWETPMTFLSDLSARKALTIKAPITLTSFEDVKLPSGESRRAAKLESRFRLSSDDNSDTALRMAAELVVRGGGAQSSGGESGAPVDMGLPGAPDDMGAAADTAADTGVITESQIKSAMKDIESASVRVSRVIWFDVDKRRVLRLQDQINTSYELKQTVQQNQGDMESPGMMGAPAGAGIFLGEEMNSQAAPAAPPEPVRVDYVMNVVTWYDDVPPAPTDKYNAGRGTAHSKDSVQEPSLSKVTGK